MRKGTWGSALPSWAAGKLSMDLSGDPYSKKNYQDLLRVLHDKWYTPPPIGKPPDFPEEEDDDVPPSAPRKPLISKDDVDKFFSSIRNFGRKLFPLFKVAGILFLVGALFWAGALAVPKLIALVPTQQATAISAQRDVIKVTSTNSPISPTKTPKPSSTPSIPISTKTPSFTLTPTPFRSEKAIIDGTVGNDEWAKASRVANLPHGVLYFQNDDDYLYMLIDLTGDTVNDNGGDYFSLEFDVNKSGTIDANKDMSYGIGRNNTMTFQYHLLTYAYTGAYPSNSKLGVGFGPSFNSATPHRIWEMAIDLSEISATPGHNVHFGTITHSSSPSFTDYYPQTIDNNFQKLFQISLVQP